MHRFWLMALFVTTLSAQQRSVTATEVAVTIRTGDQRFQIDLVPKTGGDPPRTIWRGDHEATVRARLDKHHVLLCHGDTNASMHALDLRTGKTRHVADAYDDMVVTVYGGDLFFLKHRKVVGLALHAIPWRGGDERVVAENVLVGEIGLVVGNFAFGTDIAFDHIWRFDLRDGSAKRFVDLPDKTVDVKLQLSPSGKRMAISSCVYREATLQVVDFETGKRLRQWQRLRPVADRFIPRLPISFDDEDRVTDLHTDYVDGESVEVRTTRSVKTGKDVGAPELPAKQFLLHSPDSRRWQLLGPGRTTIMEWPMHRPIRLFLAPDRSAVVAAATPDGPWRLFRRDAPATKLPDGSLWHCEWLAPTPQ